jgi:hypothetical protein
MEDEVSPSMDWWVQASCPHSTSWHQCWGAIMAEKQKVIFLLDNGAHFSVLPLSPGPWSNDKSYHLGQIWPASRALVYLASDLLLGKPSLLTLFPHSTWNSRVPAGTGFTISMNAQIHLPPGSYLCCPLLQEQRDSTVWTDEMSVGWARTALPVQIKLKNPPQLPHTKQYPLKPEGPWGLMPIINSLKQQGLLISCSSPYNKFKILIKVNFKIQVTK